MFIEDLSKLPTKLGRSYGFEHKWEECPNLAAARAICNFSLDPNDKDFVIQGKRQMSEAELDMIIKENEQFSVM